MNTDIFFGLTAVLAVLMGGIIILVPVLGLTARFALRPTLEAWARLRNDPTLAEQTELLSRQIALLEAELQHVQHTLQGLAEAQDFQRRLESPSTINR